MRKTGLRVPALRGWSAVRIASVLAFALFLAALPVSAEVTASACPTANCTANDVDIEVQAHAYASGDDTCSGVGDTIQIEVIHTLNTQGNGGAKYDFGFYTTVAPGEALDCELDILESPQATGWADLGEQDDCKDLAAGGEVVHTQVYTVPCLDDLAPFGYLDPIVIWQSWANQDDQVESCDETNVIEGTTAKCRSQVAPNPPIEIPGECGDGNVNAGEECDDGNRVDDDGCDNECMLTSCGDGIEQSGEECDDGNVVSEDGCSALCMDEYCGDNVTQAGLGEGCDDGNNLDNDGCSANCQIETPTTGEWGMVLLSLLLLGTGAATLRRRTEPTA